MGLLQTRTRCSVEDARETDARLRLFGTAHTRVQRFLGQGLDRLYSSNGLLPLSYMRRGDYVRECLGLGIRESQELVHSAPSAAWLVQEVKFLPR